MNNSNDVIRASEEQMRTLAELLVSEYGGADRKEGETYEEAYEREVLDHIEEMHKDPHNVGVLYTTFDEEDEDGNYIDEHDIQINIDICRMVNKVYVDWVLVYEEDMADEDMTEFNFDGWYSYFVDIARDHMPEEEQVDEVQKELRAQYGYDDATSIVNDLNKRAEDLKHLETYNGERILFCVEFVPKLAPNTRIPSELFSTAERAFEFCNALTDCQHKRIYPVIDIWNNPRQVDIASVH